MVALAFLGYPSSDDLIVNHINGNKFDNGSENLEWITQKENVEHAIQNNLTKTHQRKVIKLDKQGNIIKTFDSIEQACSEHKITRHAIIRVCKGKNKTAAGFFWKYVDEDEVINKSELYPIEGYSYMVTKSGQIYSKTTNKILKPMRNANGYEYVTISKNGRKKNVYIHTIVAKTFLEQNKNRLYVNHKNKIRHDNRVENLEWVTHSENMLHSYQTHNSKPL